MSHRKVDNSITWESFAEGLWKNNPVFVMLLGMCPVLAVTNSAMNALAMGLATTFVLLASGLLVSLLSKYIPRPVRIATYIVIIATFVTIIDYVIQAISLDPPEVLENLEEEGSSEGASAGMQYQEKCGVEAIGYRPWAIGGKRQVDPASATSGSCGTSVGTGSGHR